MVEGKRREECGVRAEEEEVYAEEEEEEEEALWLLLCTNVNTLQRSQKTMTPRGEEGARAACALLLNANSVRAGTAESGKRTSEVE